MRIYPIIKRIEDVLPYIDGCRDFVVVEKHDLIFIQYVITSNDTFPPISDMQSVNVNLGSESHASAVRRECRGIVFDRDGNLLSRPFHKFHNVGEKEETSLSVIAGRGIRSGHDKLDGSMIRPVMHNGKPRLMTKMGITDTSRLAEYELMTPELETLFSAIIAKNQTPLYEYMSPKNRIVVSTDKPSLTLLAIRDNTTGEYLPLPTDHPLPVCKTYCYDGMNISEIVESVSRQEKTEGVVIVDGTGERHKIKTEWYRTIHTVKDPAREARHVFHYSIHGMVDDILAILEPEDPERKVFEDFRKTLSQRLQKIASEQYQMVLDLRAVHGTNYSTLFKDVESSFFQKLVMRWTRNPYLTEDLVYQDIVEHLQGFTAIRDHTGETTRKFLTRDLYAKISSVLGLPRVDTYL